MIPLEALDVATHWPFIRRNLDLRRWRAPARALGELAAAQVVERGALVDLSASRLMAAGLTRGEARSATRALVGLQAHGVVTRRRGAGRAPDLWSFRPDLTHWRVIPWLAGARDLERSISACRCAAFCAVARPIPGQTFSFRGKAERVSISLDDHLQRPGLLSVEMPRNGAGGRATAPARAYDPVEMPRNGADGGALLLSSEDVKTSSCDVDDDARIETLRNAVVEVTGSAVFGAPARTLDELAAAAGDRCADLAATFRLRGAGIRSPVTAVRAMAALWETGVRPPPPAESIQVRMARERVARLETSLAVAERVGLDPDPVDLVELDEARQTLATVGALSA